MNVDFLTWTGDGAGNKKTTRFQPVAILTKGGHHSDDACFWVSGMPAGEVKEAGTASHVTNIIDSVESDGFTTGSDNRVERSGSEFAAMVLGADTGRREVKAVTWTGDDAAQRDITCGFDDPTLQPALVILWGATAGWVTLRTADMPEGDGVANSHAYQGTTGLADRIYRFGPDYFSVDDTALNPVNASGVTYYAIVVSAAPADLSFATFQYTGDGTYPTWHTLSEGLQPDHASLFQGDADSIAAYRGLGGAQYPQGLGQTTFVGGAFSATGPWERHGLIEVDASTWHDAGVEFYGYTFAETGVDAPSAVAADSRIGHGKLGLRGNLRTFAQLIEQGEAAREADLELRLGMIVPQFQLDQGSTYVASVTEEYLGFPRDLVGVRTFDHPDLDRVESLAECRATAGTYFYDISQVGEATRSWDDGLDWWDEQLLDEGIAAYFELADGTEETGAITTAFTENGSPSFGAALNGDGVTFAAATDYLELAHADTAGVFDFGVEDFAAHVKVKRSATTGTLQVLFGKYDGSAQRGFQLRFEATDVLAFYLGDGTGSIPNLQGVTAVTDTTWHSVSVFRVGGWLYLYLDGQLEAYAYLPHSATSATTFQVGNSGNSFIGTLDQLVIHNRAALFLANNGARSTLFDGADFVAMWPFNGGATDLFGHSDLTANNSPTYDSAVRADGAQLTLVTNKTDSPYFSRTIGAGEWFSPEAQSMVVFGKFRLDAGDGRSQVLYDTRNTTLTQNVSVYRNASNKLQAYIEDDSGNITQVSGASDVLAGSAYHSFAVVIDRSDDTVRVYLDGELDGSGALTGTPDDISNLGTLHVGADFAGSGFNVDGRVDEIGALRGRTWDLAAALEHHAGAAGGPPHAWMHGYGRRPTVEHLESAALVFHSNTAGSAALARTPIPSTNTNSWDVGAGFLYVHLPDGGNVTQDTVLASFGFYFGGRGVVHPNLGPDLLTDGDLDLATGGPPVTGWSSWSERTLGGGSIAVTPSQDQERTGGYAARFDVSSVATAGFSFIYQAVTGRQAAATYRLTGYYRTELTTSPLGGVLPCVWVQDQASGGIVDYLGRDLVTTGPATPPTPGEWRAFALDFLAPAAAFDVMVGVYAAASSTGSVYFDGLRLRRVFSWQYREPRLEVTGAPKLTTGLRDPHFGKAKVGVGSAALANGDAALDPALSGLEWMNQEARLRAGGRFSDGEALIYDLQHAGFAARIQSLEADDREVGLELQDARATIHRTFPPNLFSTFVEANLDPALDGKEKPVLIGADTGVPVHRIDLDANLKATFLLADPLTLGLHSLQAVYAYTGKDAADQKDTTERVTLSEGTDYSKDLDAGTITMLRDVGPIRLTDENNELDFNDGSDQQATLTAGLYASWAALAAHIQTQMDAASGDNITCTYSESTHKLTISSDGVTFILKTNDGANKERSAWATLGYDTAQNKTGGGPYEGDDALFESPEKDLVIRADVTGLKDDADGSFTGTASAAINLAVDFFAFLWKDVLGFGLSLIDATTRAEARSTANEVIKAYIREKTSTGDIFEILERTSLAVIVVDGSGKARFKLLRNTLPSSLVMVEDRDIVAFRERRTVADSYAQVSVLYDRDASTGAHKVRIESSATAKLNVRPDEQEFETFLTVANDAQTRAEQIATLAASRARLADVALRGLLDESLVGDLLTLTRSRAPLAPGGTNAAQQYRVRELSLAVFEPGDSDAVLVEHILVPGG